MTIATPITSPEPANKRWLLYTFAIFVFLNLVHLAIAYIMDPYGVMRDPHGRALSTFNEPRKAVYLLNRDYVPANFDGLVIGASEAVGWRIDEFTGYHFYNESFVGGVASEQRLVVEQALPKGHFKVALVGLYPGITMHHNFRDGLDKASLSQSFGSLDSFFIMGNTLRLKLLHQQPKAFPDGRFAMLAPPTPELKIDIKQDPVAIKAYHDMVQDLLNHGVKVIYVAAPLRGGTLALNADFIAAYLQQALRDLPPAPVIDFNTPEYAWFRNDPTNYQDYCHPTEKGQEILAPIINKRMHEILHDQ